MDSELDAQRRNSHTGPSSWPRHLVVLLVWSLLMALFALRSSGGLALCFFALAVWAAVGRGKSYRGFLISFFLGCGLASIGLMVKPPWRGSLSLLLAPLCIVMSIALIFVQRVLTSLAVKRIEPHTRLRPSFQFSLLTLLTVVTMVAVTLSWLRVEANRSRRQRLAVEAICKSDSGGSVVYTYWSPPSSEAGPMQRRKGLPVFSERGGHGRYGLRRWSVTTFSIPLKLRH